MATTPGPMPAESRGTEKLLDGDFMHRLEQLEIISRKIHSARQRGERRSKRRGESSEFADYRHYVVGDDIRHIDWNIYARLEKLFLKLFLEEEELHVSILLDASGSMAVGSPSKLLYAKRVAAAVAYIGLCNDDRIGLYVYRDGLVGQLRGLRNRRMTPRLMRFLDDQEPEGLSGFGAAARQFAHHHTQKGVVLVVSDLLDKYGFEEGLRFLLGRGLDVYVVQVLAREEIEPDLAGDLKLVDCEDDESAEVTISRPLLDRYRATVEGYCESIRAYCTRRGIAYLLTTTDRPFERLILHYLRQRGLVR